MVLAVIRRVIYRVSQGLHVAEHVTLDKIRDYPAYDTSNHERNALLISFWSMACSSQFPWIVMLCCHMFGLCNMLFGQLGC